MLHDQPVSSNEILQSSSPNGIAGAKPALVGDLFTSQGRQGKPPLSENKSTPIDKLRRRIAAAELIHERVRSKEARMQPEHEGDSRLVEQQQANNEEEKKQAPAVNSQIVRGDRIEEQKKAESDSDSVTLPPDELEDGEDSLFPHQTTYARTIKVVSIRDLLAVHGSFKLDYCDPRVHQLNLTIKEGDVVRSHIGHFHQ